MRKILVLVLLGTLVFGNSPAEVYSLSYEMQEEVKPSGTVEPFKRGGYRSPRGSYNPGIGSPGRTTPARPDNAVRNPAPPRTTPSPRTGFGGFFWRTIRWISFGDDSRITVQSICRFFARVSFAFTAKPRFMDRCYFYRRSTNSQVTAQWILILQPLTVKEPERALANY